MQYKHITMDRHTNLWSVVTSRKEEKVMRLGRGFKGSFSFICHVLLGKESNMQW